MSSFKRIILVTFLSGFSISILSIVLYSMISVKTQIHNDYYYKGFQDGFKYGYHNGYKDGFKGGYKDTQ